MSSLRHLDAGYKCNEVGTRGMDEAGVDEAGELCRDRMQMTAFTQPWAAPGEETYQLGHSTPPSPPEGDEQGYPCLRVTET